MKLTKRQILQQALTHLDKATAHARHGLDDELVIDAVAMRLIAMIDTLARLSDDDRGKLFGDQWPLMRGMRNRLVHGYATVSTAAIRLTVGEDLPGIRSDIVSALASITD